ncbi:MAG: phage Gp37/Gp68 family protein [Alphaproteobacteria bacterium]|nr:phage Gp37/Gp68 family protein [Alphaproteobacteria bacterium]
MVKNSNIPWCDHTFNPWIGCEKVSAACDHCYAEAWDHRFGRDFAERRLTSRANWRQPLAWDAEAAASGRRAKVFSASLADAFDPKVPDEWRDHLMVLIAITPHLDWLLLTKRPAKARDYLRENWDGIMGRVHDMARGHLGAEVWTLELHHDILLRGHLPNLWLGVTAENQAAADARIPVLLDTPAAGHFVSLEPLIGPVNLNRITERISEHDGASVQYLDALNGTLADDENGIIDGAFDPGAEPILDWVIVGGESGPNARPTLPDWVRDLIQQCAETDTPIFFKQWGEWAPGECCPPPRRKERTAKWWNDEWQFGELSVRAQRDLHYDDQPDLYRVGREAAGRHIDGVEHLGTPFKRDA